MANVTVRDMLQAGLHFGHQTRRWNPKMKPYIYGPRNGIYIVNLDLTKRLFDKACDFITDEVKNGGFVLFVGTKRQAQAIISEEAKRCGMYYVDHRWLGGMLTNFQTIKNSIERLKSIESMQEDGSINRFPKKEILLMEKERIKLERNVGGIKDMRSLPSVIFVVDPRKESIAINEATKLNIPVVAITDTNCDPDNVDFIIPGNDDAIRSIRLISTHVAESVLAGQAMKDGEDASEEAVAAAMADAGSEMETESVEKTTEPVEKTAEPVEATAEPVEKTAEPVETTVEPVEKTEEPVETTVEAVEKTEEPAAKGE